jgi:phosphatidylserine decarboxylase
MGIHKEGRSWLITSFSLWILITAMLIYLDVALVITAIVSTLLLFIFIILLQFFRKPYREGVTGSEMIISPADGKIVVIEKTTETEYLQEEVIQISVFMSPFNVHMNWYPVAGEVEYYKYHPGKYLVAWHPKSSTENERSTIVVRRSDGRKILFRQIAGILARKICCYAQEGIIVKQSNEFGFIKFGSRVDIFIPLDSKINVKIGDIVKGSQTILATVPTEKK